VVQNHYADYYLKLEVHKLMVQQSTVVTMLIITYQKSEHINILNLITKHLLTDIRTHIHFEPDN
jgi:hypothetical protein